MEKYSASYANTNNNFVLLNLQEEDVKSRLFSHYCVIKNILMRSSVTHPSLYLIEELGELEESIFDEKQRLKYFFSKTPNWSNRIKGSGTSLYNPAKKFFFEIIPNYLDKYRFIQSLILPEAMINEIVDEPKEDFKDQCVDFFLPQANLVIEIDGFQHARWGQKMSDQNRDKFLKKNGFTIIRIGSNSIANPDTKLIQALNQIKAIMTSVEGKKSLRIKPKLIGKLAEYEEIYKNPGLDGYYSSHRQRLNYEFVMRLQILILTMLQKGKLDIDTKVWNIKLKSDFPEAEKLFILAYNDVMLWLENLCKLSKQEIEIPRIEVNSNNQVDPKNIDISLFTRWSEDYLLNLETIFVRTDYFDEKDYFKVSTAERIDYQIDLMEEQSDLQYLEFFLRNLFPKFNEFRDGQVPIIAYALEGNDCIGIMPTGAGKSLCYQFVCLLQPSINFIVSPLLSLIYDQKENLDKLKIDRTNFVTSDQTAPEKAAIIDKFAKGQYLMIWISPERFQTTEFREKLETINIERNFAYAVIDEVHCVSEWGHDFRTSYLNLARTIRRYCPQVVLLGLTATASRFVLEDLKKEFDIDSASIKTVSSMRRENLNFYVIESPYSQRYDDLKKLLVNKNEKFGMELFKLDGDNTKSGIIFTLTARGRNGCEQIAMQLGYDLNINSKAYHGKLDDKNGYNQSRKSIQDEFAKNKIPLLVATKAFGMGVNKKNIDYTIHYGLPWSIEAFYQEAGRAGRAEQNADCYIIYSPESCEEDVLNEIFSVQTDIPRIKELSRSFNADLSTIFYLWVFNNEGIEPELEVMRWVMRTLYKGTHNVISCNSFYTKPKVEKAIYRLSVLGLIEDWTILNWGNATGQFEVEVTDYSERSVKEKLKEYIRSYDSDFFEKIDTIEYQPYREILTNQFEKKPYVRYMKLLLKWSYDNIAYQRRRAIKTIWDLCLRNPKNEEIQRHIENYFSFTGVTELFDIIAYNERDYYTWFKVLFVPDDPTDPFSREKILSIENAEDALASLQRYLESYRFNTGLNFVYALLQMRTGEFYKSDARERLNNAFNVIDTFEPGEREKVIEKCIEFCLDLSPEKRTALGDFLSNRYPERAKSFYETLRDIGSLTVALSIYHNDLNNIWENFV